jgi:hypothetical protein
MPGDSGVTVVITLVCFLFCTQGCGCIERPAFPAPSDLRRRDFQQNSGASRRGNTKLRRMNANPQYFASSRRTRDPYAAAFCLKDAAQRLSRNRRAPITAVTLSFGCRMAPLFAICKLAPDSCRADGWRMNTSDLDGSIVGRLCAVGADL